MAGNQWSFSSQQQLPTIGPTVRKIAGYVAVAAFTWAAMVWLSSWIPGSAPASVGAGISFVAFPFLFVALGVMIIDQNNAIRAGGPTRRRGTIPLRGWRAPVAALLGIIAIASFGAMWFSGGLPVERIDGKYYEYDKTDGSRQQVSKEEYDRRNAVEARGSAGIFLVMSGVVALTLTQPKSDPTDPAVPLPPVDPPRGKLHRRVRGSVDQSVSGPGEPEEVLARMQASVPVPIIRSDVPGGAIEIHADWTTPLRWPIRAAHVRADGRIEPASLSTSSWIGTVQPGSKHAGLVALLGAAWTLIIGTVGATFCIGFGLSFGEPVPAVFGAFVFGYAAFAAHSTATAASRASRGVARALQASVEASAPLPSPPAPRPPPTPHPAWLPPPPPPPPTEWGGSTTGWEPPGPGWGPPPT